MISQDPLVSGLSVLIWTHFYSQILSKWLLISVIFKALAPIYHLIAMHKTFNEVNIVEQLLLVGFKKQNVLESRAGYALQ